MLVCLEIALFVPPDTKGTDGVSGLAVDGSLTGQLLKHLGRTGQTITRLANGDIEDELLDAELPHGIGSFAFGLDNLIRTGIASWQKFQGRTIVNAVEELVGDGGWSECREVEVGDNLDGVVWKASQDS